ncbi:globin domain-containing protein [Streptomyces sp. NPDC059918]|uniref:globin domain-containing protein n=1 Tax=unclassified Streptomyces TaxID=2593676 RepID=UPI00364F1D89
MLSEYSARTLRETLPAVTQALPVISRRFYDLLFADHPALLRDVFNRSRHATGEQPAALAAAIAEFAAHLVRDPSALPEAMLSRIAHRHASVGVRPEQYSLVHEYLFRAIVEVLGDAATPEVAAAWDETYWLMAERLGAAESDARTAAGLPAGPLSSSWREWVVVDRVEATGQVTTFRLVPADGGPAPVFRPGQYTSLRVSLPDERWQTRQYSLTGPPDSDTWTISVKRVQSAQGPDGEVSHHLHLNVPVGARVELSPPFGDFVLPALPGPLLLVSAGIGVTPVLALLRQLAGSDHQDPVTVVHADRSPRTHVGRDEHQALVDALPSGTAHFWYTEPQHGHHVERLGRPDLDSLPVPCRTHVYVSGPPSFVTDVRTRLQDRGTPPEDIHYEVFGADTQPYPAGGHAGCPWSDTAVG